MEDLTYFAVTSVLVAMLVWGVVILAMEIRDHKKGWDDED